MMSSSTIIIVTATLVSLYIIFIAIPSIILNFLIVLSFIRDKTLHTPSNLLSVHFCVVGLIVSLLYSPLTVTAFITVMLYCTCSVLYYHWTIGHVFHFSLYPLNILLLTFSYFLILKFSSKIVTFRKVVVALIVIWVISTAGHVPIIFLTPMDLFTNCCETVCLNETATCNQSLFTTFTPHTLTTPGRIYYNIRVELLIIVPSVMVIVFSIAAYCIYKKSVVHETEELRIRMLLLPPLMTFSVAVFILGQDVVNWQPSQVDEPSLPGIFVFVMMGLIWDSNGIYFALLILYFNVKLRRSVQEMVRKLFHPFNNRVSTTKSGDNDTENETSISLNIATANTLSTSVNSTIVTSRT